MQFIPYFTYSLVSQYSRNHYNMLICCYKKNIMLVSMLKTVVLFNIFVENMIFYQDSLMNRKF